MLPEVSLLGDGTVSDMVWARPAVTVLGIDCPPVIGSAAAIQPHARARLNLCVPPGMDPVEAQATQVATAAIGLLIGIAIGSLVSGAARSAIRLRGQRPRLRER